MTPVHPMRLLMRLGISDGPAAIAIIITICLQYIFLAKLWEGYPIRYMGDVIDGRVVAAMAALSILGGLVILAVSLRRWSIGVTAARRLERPAESESFDAIRDSLEAVASRSTLSSTPALLYTPKNANALEVREHGGAVGKAIVVGLDQRAYQRREPASFAAMLGHEVSHLELATTRGEIGTRRAVALHFRIFGWLCLIFLLVLGFIDRRGIGSAPALGGFVPIFDGTIYVQLVSQFAVLVLSSAIVFVYSYFFIVRREHFHDFRGSQLAESDALTSVFAASRADSFPARLVAALKTFFVLHPNPTARYRVLKRHDIILLSAILYPAVVSGLEPLILLLTAGWRDFFGVARETWNLGLTVAAGLFLYAVLRADLARLGLGLLLDVRRYSLAVPVYALVAGAATQMSRVVLEISFGLRRGFPISDILERIWSGTIVGGGRIALMTAGILALLAYLNAVRIAATGEAHSGRGGVVDGVLSALIVTGAFTIASLTTLAFILSVSLFCLTIALVYVAWFLATNSCAGCGRRRLSALRIVTQCSCGREQLPLLRRWTTQPFEKQLTADLT